jgi:hypothetical protein
MTLWHLLLGFCFSLPCGGALSAANTRTTGLGGYALAIAVGVTVGAASCWTMKSAGDAAFTYIRRQPEQLQEKYFRYLYLAAMAWILISGLLAGLISSSLLRMTV